MPKMEKLLLSPDSVNSFFPSSPSSASPTTPRQFPLSNTFTAKIIKKNQRSLAYALEYKNRIQLKPLKPKSSAVLTKELLDMKLQATESRRFMIMQEKVRRINERLRLVKQRSTLQQQKKRLMSLRLRSKNDYKMKAAELRRQLHLQELINRNGATIERAQNLAIVARLKKCLDLRRSYSTTFAETLGELKSVDINAASFMAPQTPTVTFTHTGKSRRKAVMIESVIPSSASSTNSSSSSSSTMSSSTIIARSSARIKSSNAQLSLVSLHHVFGDMMPTITRSTLTELSLEAISSNVQLRHDMVFDPNLEFRPNDDGDRGVQKKIKADVFWKDIEEDVSGRRYGTPSYKRIPVLINEIKEILNDLVATEEYKQRLDSHMDVILIAQQLEHGVFDPISLMTFLADIMKAHCAPLRDPLIDQMLKDCVVGNFIISLRSCFEILERMKLDVANDQLRRLRPYVVESSVEFEWEHFKELLKDKKITLKATVNWLTPFVKSRDASTAAQSSSDLFNNAFLDLISAPKEASAIPETFRLDTSRITAFQNDWQDTTIMACLLMTYRQLIGKHSSAQIVTEMKKNLWILLNDASTTLSHISLYLCQKAGEIRGKAMNDQEMKIADGLVTKTLSPDSALYALMKKKIGEQILDYLKTKKLAQQDILAKKGLLELSDELSELAERVRVLVEHNKLVYGKVYDEILKSK